MLGDNFIEGSMVVLCDYFLVLGDYFLVLGDYFLLGGVRDKSSAIFTFYISRSSANY